MQNPNYYATQQASYQVDPQQSPQINYQANLQQAPGSYTYAPPITSGHLISALPHQSSYGNFSQESSPQLYSNPSFSQYSNTSSNSSQQVHLPNSSSNSNIPQGGPVAQTVSAQSLAYQPHTPYCQNTNQFSPVSGQQNCNQQTPTIHSANQYQQGQQIYAAPPQGSQYAPQPTQYNQQPAQCSPQQGYPNQNQYTQPPQQGYTQPAYQQPPQQNAQPNFQNAPLQNQPNQQMPTAAYYPPPTQAALMVSSGVPNRYWIHRNTVAGVATSASSNESLSVNAHLSYEVELHGVEQIFGNKFQPWNKDYDQAQKIFGTSIKSPVIRAGIHAQHLALYRQGSSSRTVQAELRNAEDLLQLIEFGERGGVRHMYTYVIVNNMWRFCETGATFLKDMFSKHAMHADCAREVRYSGEFHLQRPSYAGGPWKLVIDNNSGTYGPDPTDLPKLAELLKKNFPSLDVEALDFRDPKLKAYVESLKAENAAKGKH